MLLETSDRTALVRLSGNDRKWNALWKNADGATIARSCSRTHAAQAGALGGHALSMRLKDETQRCRNEVNEVAVRRNRWA